ncbi:hypothetical protein [Chitinophaga sancti]|uniref:Lipoprotein n=1 Tax=Chitinophaga sancti TaxID=1004 RepID=A0A1K1S4A0_9BACT|nr:hypothetical protein [Chitinophaga sancti]WQD63761.1 hypothetical protein U0033_05085 [Chitinophaga sancti]WQG90614.1 hypothetical protein SR876_03835 [Chitinophaga sancti]SFW79010.1 hypothetical protein SAMN05661012_04701 [Chitinophaga sancti]
MKIANFYPFLFLLAACHQQEQKAAATVAADTAATPPIVNDKPGIERHLVFSNFKDSVAAGMELTRSQLFHYLKSDTTSAKSRHAGHELRRLGNMYVMIIDFNHGSYRLYTFDSTTYTRLDDEILGFNTDADGDNGGGTCEYEFVNDSTIEVVEKDVPPEGSNKPEQLTRTTFAISYTGKIKKTGDRQ